MSKQKNLNVEMKFTFSIPFDEFELDEFDEEDFKEIANDYFFECGGIYKADYYDFEFNI